MDNLIDLNILKKTKKKLNYNSILPTLTKFRDNTILYGKNFSNNIDTYLEEFNEVGDEVAEIIYSCDKIVKNNEEIISSVWKHFKQNINTNHIKYIDSNDNKKSIEDSNYQNSNKNVKKKNKIVKKNKIYRDDDTGNWYIEN